MNCTIFTITVFFTLLSGMVLGQNGGYHSPLAYSSDSSFGVSDWENMDSVLVLDGKGTKSILNNNNESTYLLKVSNFGFSLPAAATVTGIRVFWTSKSLLGEVENAVVRLMKGGEMVGNDLGNNGKWRTEWRNITSGNCGSDWGENWSAGEITNTGFGVAVAAISHVANEVARIDNISIGVWYNGDCSVLPIELIDFNVNLLKGAVNLEWATASETNNDYFTIERSADGEKFNPLETLMGAGTSSELHIYCFRDPDPINGLNYYRIKQTDYDGTVSYSDIVVLRVIANYNKTFMSQQANTVYIQIPEQAEQIECKIYSIAGQAQNVLCTNKDSTIIINSECLAKGTYFVRLSYNDTIEVWRLIIL